LPPSSEIIEIIRDDPNKVLDLELNLISSAVSQIELIFSSAKVFHIQQRLGIIQALKDALTKNTVSVRILMSKADGYIEEDFRKLKKVDGLNVGCFNYDSDIRIKTLVVDRAQSLVMEIKEEEEEEGEVLKDGISKAKAKQQQKEKEIISFNKIIGLSTYSNSKSTALSYAAIFETLWDETGLHEQLRKSNKELEIANEQLELNYKIQKEFINVAAHEIRTPTQSILGYAEMLYMYPEGSREYLSPILRNAERLQRLTEDILDMAKIESQTLKLNKEQFNLCKAVFPLVQDMRNQIDRHNYNVRKKIIIDFDNSEAADKEIIIQADKGRIIQVISNILYNAIRFAKEGNITISIKINDVIISRGVSNGNSNSQGEVIVSIKDTGIGIDPHILPKLFSKFNVKAEAGGGSGLGLFISKSIVEAHGGRIWAQNNADGIGATFAFSLPLSK
jgi:two-component system, OmpR family, sensor histidine kinase VicK